MTLKSVIRTAKAIGKGYSDLELKVRQATCNDNWGPSATLMEDICRQSYNSRDFPVIMEILDKRLNDSGKNWRHVFKALTVIRYLLENGNEDVIRHTRENLHVIKTLKEYQYIDEEGRDQGLNVRNKSKEITLLFADESKLKELRSNRNVTRDRLGYDDEDADLKRAIEASKQQSNMDEERRLARQEEEDLQRAIEMSEREAIERKKMNFQTTGDSYYGAKPAKNDNIIDFFGSVETQQPINHFNDPFANFGGMDPFQQQQQQQMMYQQQEQQRLFNEQQAFLQQQMLAQQQEQLRQEQLLQQQQQQQQFLLLQQQQQQQQQNPFGSMQQQNAGNPFGGAVVQPRPPTQQQQQQKQQQQLLDLSSNPNAVLDPFANLSTMQSNPVGPNIQQSGGFASGSNPFGASNSSPQQKPLVNLDALGTSSNTTPSIPKNPFSSTNTSKYQWEQPAKQKPLTLAEIQSSPQQTNSTLGGNTYGQSMTNSLTGSSVPRNPFGNQPTGNQFGNQPFAQTQPFGQQNAFGQQGVNQQGFNQQQFGQQQPNPFGNNQAQAPFF